MNAKTSTDIRLWIVAGLAVLSPIGATLVTRGQEVQAAQDSVVRLEKCERQIEQQDRTNKELTEAIYKLSTAIEVLTVKVEAIKDHRR